MNYQQDARRSDKVFMETCAAPLKKLFKASSVISTAPHKEKFERLLDYSGVDYLVDSPRFGLVPIQAKVSFGGKQYRNFVIRRSRSSGALTDYDKLSRAKKYGTISPLWHVAVFVDDNDNADAANGAEFFAQVSGIGSELKCLAKQHQNGSFYTCDWQRLEDYGVKLFRLVRRADSLKEMNK